jgi:hypothetical protein
MSAGDCQVLTDEMQSALDGCDFIEHGLQHQQESGGVLKDLEILGSFNDLC